MRRRGSADGKAETEAAVGAREIELVARDFCLRPDMIRCHQRDGFGFEVASALKGAAIEQHLQEMRVVADRPHHAGATGFPAPRKHRIPDSGYRSDKAIV